jgi:hypothetical protein
MDGALMAGYNALALGLPTGLEGEQFIPPESGADWAKVTIVPTGKEVASLGVGGMDQQKGFMQITFSTQPGKGKAGLLAFYQAVENYFVAGKTLTNGTQDVKIEGTSRANITEKDGWLKLATTVNWNAYITRPAI